LTPAIHTEATFEEAIVAALLDRGWLQGTAESFDRERALVSQELFQFLQDSQPTLWATLKAQHKDGLEAALLDTLEKNLESFGTLHVLRNGIKLHGKKVELAVFKPAHGLNPEVQVRYQQNRLVVTRQVRFLPGKEESIDLLLSLNGLPVATVELKTPLTGQTVKDAIKQYRDRDAKAKLFQFKRRAVVHFAVDPELAYMTTRLAGKATHFLPFNRGCDGGAGNPAHPGGHSTAYLWQEVWDRDSFLDILGGFAFVEVQEQDGKKKETLVFPRYHQLDAVRKMVADARDLGPGHNYLVQHSAGSGKTKTIAWLAHRLASLHNAQDVKLFDSVVVVTDRRVLDKQLQDAIYQLDHKQGVVQLIDQHSDQLATALEKGTPIIVTTLQKFPYVTQKVAELPGHTYAVIVDEAHSSQTGESARTMKEVLAAPSLEAAAEQEDGGQGDDYEDRITQVMQSRGPQKNLSFFAFTATPKGKTLEVFGRPGADGEPTAFHLYSMRQAIEEGFILDVLANYTTYKTYYGLVKAIEDDPDVPKHKAQAKLARFMSLHPHNLAQKTEVMVEHFRRNVRQRIGGRAKAMVVTASRLHAVRYKQAFDRYLAEKGYSDIKALVAFSGKVKDPEGDKEYTEVGMNKGIQEKELPGKFDSDEYQLLLVAEKYQTGFDQPLLHTMYVDKRLSGVHAVQTLSRLNRTTPGKEDCFVLDFVNEADEIREAFKPYYEQTILAEKADPQQLYTLQQELDELQVYFQSEVESFAKVFYLPPAQQKATDQAKLHGILKPATDRYKALDEEQQELFRGKLQAYVRLYAFLAQVMPFTDPDLEKLYSFARLLLPLLDRPGAGQDIDLDGDVKLKFYRLEKAAEGSIVLTPGEGGIVGPPTAVGTGKAKDEHVPLSTIVEVLNDKFGTTFTPIDELFLDQVREQTKTNPTVALQAKVNTFENFAIALKDVILQAMIDQLGSNEFIVRKYLDESEFQQVTNTEMARRIWTEVREGVG